MSSMTPRRQRNIIEVMEAHEADIARLKAALSRFVLVDTVHNHDAEFADYLPLAGGSMTGYLKVIDGTAILPGLSFDTDPNTGIYRVSENIMGIATGGATRWSIDGGGILLSHNGAIVQAGDGDASATAYGFASDANTGMYRLAENQIGWSVAGRKMGLSSSSLNFGDGSTTGYSRIRVDDAGDASTPAYHFVGDTNTGIFWKEADQLAISTGGTSSAHFRTPFSNGSLGSREGGALVVEGGDLGTSSGNIGRAASFRLNNGNSGTLEILSLRTAAGSSWTTASMGIQRITDTTAQSSIWFDGSGVGVNTSEPDLYGARLAVNGMIATVPGTASGSNAHLVAISGGYYALRIQSSSRRFKEDIRDLDPSSAKLRPTRYWSKSDERYLHGLIAEEVVEALGSEAAVYDEDGEVRDYFDRAVIAHLVAKVNRLESLLAEAH